MEKDIVSVIIPCRNEEKFIEGVIKSLLKQTYPKDKMEILFVDGRSEDKTREIIKKYAKKYDFIKLLDNPYKYVPHAMNIGIKEANGDIIIRMDAHSEYPEDYVEKLVYWLNKLNADNVGGVWITVPSYDNLVAKSIALAISHPFGVGNALYRIVRNNKEPIEVDTVPFGCYHRKVFDKIGLYDEDLIRNQDDELNARLRKKGGNIFLIPEIKVKYYARDTWEKISKMFYQYGYFKPLVNIKVGSPATLRQLVPPLFVFALFTLTILAFINKIFFKILIILLIIYFLLNFLASLKISLKEKNMKFIPFLVITFFIIHLSYGLGYLKGIIDFLLLKKHKKDNLNIGLSR